MGLPGSGQEPLPLPNSNTVLFLNLSNLFESINIGKSTAVSRASFSLTFLSEPELVHIDGQSLTFVKVLICLLLFQQYIPVKPQNYMHSNYCIKRDVPPWIFEYKWSLQKHNNWLSWGVKKIVKVLFFNTNWKEIWSYLDLMVPSWVATMRASQC